MRNQNGSNPNPKIESLLQKIAQSRSSLAEERVRDQKRAERERNRLGLILGSMLIREAEDSPEFRDMLIRIVQGSEMSDSDKAFLAKKGWL